MTLNMLSIDVTPEGLMSVFIGLMILGVISWVTLVAMKRKKDADNSRMPRYREMAMVVDRQQVPPGTVLLFDNPWVLFELQNGRRVRVSATKTCRDLIVGDRGMLTWQGDQMISFSRTTGWSQTAQAEAHPMPQPMKNVPARQNCQGQQTENSTATPETVFCTKCGRKQRASNVTCWACGADIKK